MPRKKRDNWKEKKYWFKHNKEDKRKYKHHGCGIYFLGFIGAAVYYVQMSTTFWEGVVGVLKALVWPAFLVYQLLGGH